MYRVDNDIVFYYYTVLHRIPVPWRTWEPLRSREMPGPQSAWTTDSGILKNFFLNSYKWNNYFRLFSIMSEKNRKIRIHSDFSEERELDTPSSEESNLQSGYESAESNRYLPFCFGSYTFWCLSVYSNSAWCGMRIMRNQGFGHSFFADLDPTDFLNADPWSLSRFSGYESNDSMAREERLLEDMLRLKLNTTANSMLPPKQVRW